MNRTITVRGVGTARTKPDRVIITFELEDKDMDYEKAIDNANSRINALCRSLEGVGFEKGDLKTADFSVRMNYEGIQDERGNYRTVFDGYVCIHNLKLAFDFDNELLSRVLSAIAVSKAAPQFNIEFTVKEPSRIKSELLRLAAENARSKAEVLCTASGVRLGTLLNIDYNWNEANLFSNTRLINAKNEAMVSFDHTFNPEEIASSDSVTFTWEIE